MLTSRFLSQHRVRPVVLLAQSQKVLLSSTTATTTSDLHLIINAVGKDRLGIVSDVTGMVIAAGGNVGDSQAAKLGSHFSLMMEMSIPKDNLDALKQRIGSMPGMNAAVYEDEVQDTVQTPQIGYTGRFSLEGADNPGIVHKITSALSKHGLSIDKMSTGQDIAPQGGTVLFRMDGIVTAAAPLAAGFDADKIKADLESIGDSLNCDVNLEDV